MLPRTWPKETSCEKKCHILTIRSPPDLYDEGDQRTYNRNDCLTQADKSCIGSAHSKGTLLAPGCKLDNVERLSSFKTMSMEDLQTSLQTVRDVRLAESCTAAPSIMPSAAQQTNVQTQAETCLLFISLHTYTLT